MFRMQASLQETRCKLSGQFVLQFLFLAFPSFPTSIALSPECPKSPEIPPYDRHVSQCAWHGLDFQPGSIVNAKDPHGGTFVFEDVRQFKKESYISDVTPEPKTPPSREQACDVSLHCGSSVGSYSEVCTLNHTPRRVAWRPMIAEETLATAGFSPWSW